MAGVTPFPVPVHRALPSTKSELQAGVSTTTAPVKLARPTEQGHRPPCVQRQGNLYGLPSHVDQLCATTGVKTTLLVSGNSGTEEGHLSLHKRANDSEEPARPAYQGHRPPGNELQLGKLYGRKKSLDHGNLPLRYEGNVDDQK